MPGLRPPAELLPVKSGELLIRQTKALNTKFQGFFISVCFQLLPEINEGILQDVNVWVDNRDTIYVKSESFKFSADDDFIIVYGVNRTQTGFATFINVSLYGDGLWNGVAGTVFTNELKYPADEYFPEGDENGKNYFVVKLARRITEENEITISYSTGNTKGSAYGVDNNQKIFLIIRMYLNQETKVASSAFDIIWGHAILFTKTKRPARVKHDGSCAE